MIKRSLLEGITRPGYLGVPPVNPDKHAPFGAQNRLRIAVVSPEGKVRTVVDHVDNIMCTFGLNQLCQLVATGGQASSWVSACLIGTDTTAAASTQDALVASTARVVVGAGSMSMSNLGARTCRFLMTFASNNPAGAAAINEVGLFCNSTGNNQAAARSMLGTASVQKGASDSIQISYDVVFTTG